MPYASKMSPSAKRQLKVCFNCYNQHDEMMIWLKGLVSKAEQGYSDRVSLDLNEWFGSCRNLALNFLKIRR
jgi:hypothetical protein